MSNFPGSRLLGRGAIAALMSTSLAFSPIAAQACTSFLLSAKDGGKVYGRTLEFGLPLNSQLIVIPRNLTIKGTAPDGTADGGLAWTGKYGAAGANGLGLPVLIDGMNEKGLAGGLLFFPGLAKFQDVPPAEAGNSIASFEMLTYILTSFATVAEVRANLPKIKVSNAPQATFQGLVPLHVTLHDAGGNSLVIEYVDGHLNMYDNPTGVLTNAPALPWHLANLGLYGNLSGKEPAPRKVGDLTIAAPSTGAGLHGMPGDSLSPSRFVRAFNFVQNLPDIPTTAQASTAARHILNNFDIPPGSVVTVAGGAGGGVAGFEITEWSGIADLKNMTYSIWNYANPTARKLDFSKLDLDAKAVRLIPINQPAADIDLSQ
ncbi:choloylglycine hydrolase family protein [Ancylobacter sp. A5.8]|uniref:linear amide C-N hydrolase n=1 Tax=Ancylobacter gelatini TaxID=2919920 RepID=UPI001F4D64B2|nr:choloylglycine hydrolase family protein [Ancylobacter gelatini]MCJ8142370.1 choloylglycine hydrolase family protein [Ancylobacter gelatini]